MISQEIHNYLYINCYGMITNCNDRTDEYRLEYTGVLCGLGWDPNTGKGLYEDHDIECTFDTIFTQEDLDQVITTILPIIYI